MSTVTMHLSVHIDQVRVSRIVERGVARLRRLSRKKRIAERKHITNQIRDCVGQATCSVQK